jgi:Amt family ammonium transporter
VAVTYAILRLLDATLGIRVSREQEIEGLDLSLHDERAYNH